MAIRLQLFSFVKFKKMEYICLNKVSFKDSHIFYGKGQTFKLSKLNSKNKISFAKEAPNIIHMFLNLKQ